MINWMKKEKEKKATRSSQKDNKKEWNERMKPCWICKKNGHFNFYSILTRAASNEFKLYAHQYRLICSHVRVGLTLNSSARANQKGTIERKVKRKKPDLKQWQMKIIGFEWKSEIEKKYYTKETKTMGCALVSIHEKQLVSLILKISARARTHT